MADVLDRARAAVTDRADLPGMSLLEHLEELRKRLVQSAIALAIGLGVAYGFKERLYGIIQAPLDQLHVALNFTHPTDGLNLYLKTAFFGGAILTSPFILYQVWLFISPGLYKHEKRYIVPFMAATVGLFFGGAFFAYHFVLPGLLRVLIFGFGSHFHPMITIEEYTNFFLSIILGLGISFELPILVFFLALFGIVDAGLLWRNARYAILAIFIIAAIICPAPDPFTMCIFALPMLALYFLSILVAYMVHPKRRKAKEVGVVLLMAIAAALCLPSAAAQAKHPASEAKAAAHRFSGAEAYEYAKEFIAIGPRYAGSGGHQKAEAFIAQHFAPEAMKGDFEKDEFTANTPIGAVAMRNYIVRYPGKRDGVVVLCTHYETNYPLREIGFVGANDGGSTTGLLMEIGDVLRSQTQGDKLLDGYSVWLLFDDGEEAIRSWSSSDSLYGTRHLAAKWQNDGTLKRVKAYLVADMIGDKDLDIMRDLNSTPWLEDLVYQAAKNTGNQAHFFATQNAEEDDQLPFAQRGVPVADVIDADFGPHDAAHPDGWHHTAEDTLDKISARSLQIDGEVFLEAIRLIDQR